MTIINYTRYVKVINIVIWYIHYIYIYISIMVGNNNTSPIIYYIYQYEGDAHVGLHKMYRYTRSIIFFFLLF